MGFLSLFPNQPGVQTLQPIFTQNGLIDVDSLKGRAFCSKKSISTNAKYDDINDLRCYRQATDVQLPHLCDCEIEELLSKVKRTAAGCDDLPAWLFRNGSYELAGIVAHVLNCSFSSVCGP